LLLLHLLSGFGSPIVLRLASVKIISKASALSSGDHICHVIAKIANHLNRGAELLVLILIIVTYLYVALVVQRMMLPGAVSYLLSLFLSPTIALLLIHLRGNSLLSSGCSPQIPKCGLLMLIEVIGRMIIMAREDSPRAHLILKESSNRVSPG